MEGFLSRKEIEKIGFKEIGDDVLISSRAYFYGASNMKIGNHVRIDDFCIFIGTIILEDYIHIAGYTSIHASKGSVRIGSFSTLSSRVAVYAASDDYSGDFMTSPLINEKYTNTIYSDIIIGKNVIVGTGSTILPNSVLEEGVAVGAMSMVNKKLETWNVYAGIPCKKIKERSRRLLSLETEFLMEKENHEQ